jgi:hypothetical protein
MSSQQAACAGGESLARVRSEHRTDCERAPPTPKRVAPQVVSDQGGDGIAGCERVRQCVGVADADVRLDVCPASAGDAETAGAFSHQVSTSLAASRGSVRRAIAAIPGPSSRRPIRAGGNAGRSERRTREGAAARACTARRRSRARGRCGRPRTVPDAERARPRPGSAGALPGRSPSARRRRPRGSCRARRARPDRTRRRGGGEVGRGRDRRHRRRAWPREALAWVCGRPRRRRGEHVEEAPFRRLDRAPVRGHDGGATLTRVGSERREQRVLAHAGEAVHEHGNRHVLTDEVQQRRPARGRGRRAGPPAGRAARRASIPQPPSPGRSLRVGLGRGAVGPQIDAAVRVLAGIAEPCLCARTPDDRSASASHSSGPMPASWN